MPLSDVKLSFTLFQKQKNSRLFFADYFLSVSVCQKTKGLSQV